MLTLISFLICLAIVVFLKRIVHGKYVADFEDPDLAARKLRMQEGLHRVTSGVLKESQGILIVTPLLCFTATLEYGALRFLECIGPAGSKRWTALSQRLRVLY